MVRGALFEGPALSDGSRHGVHVRCEDVGRHGIVRCKRLGRRRRGGATVGAVRAVGEGAVGQVRGACAAGTRPGGHVGLCLHGGAAGVAATEDAAAAALTRAAQKNCASAEVKMAMMVRMVTVMATAAVGPR